MAVILKHQGLDHICFSPFAFICCTFYTFKNITLFTFNSNCGKCHTYYYLWLYQKMTILFTYTLADNFTTINKQVNIYFRCFLLQFSS